MMGRHIIAGFPEKHVTKIVQDLILQHKILGFTLFKWNIESAEQLFELNQELQALARQAGYSLILAVDQEGGRVARLPLPFSQIPPMRQWGDLYQKTNDVSLLQKLGKILAHEVKSVGFNLNYAPVVDVDTNPQNPIIGDRAFASDPQIVADCARAFSVGMHEENILNCFKHFPGHGHTDQDSHLELPTDLRLETEIQKIDLLPYRELIQDRLIDTIMTAHVVFEKIDAGIPATISAKIISQILRQDLQYDGVIFSDDLLMQAILGQYDLHETAKKFFEIGGDAVLIGKKPEVGLEMIERLSAKKDQNLFQKLDISKKRLQKLLQKIPTISRCQKSWQAFLSEHARFIAEAFS